MNNDVRFALEHDWYPVTFAMLCFNSARKYFDFISSKMNCENRATFPVVLNMIGIVDCIEVIAYCS